MDTVSKDSEIALYISVATLLISLVALAISVYFSYRSNKRDKEASKLNQEQFTKIKDDAAKANCLAKYPSWFAERMKYDQWRFGLLTTNGQIIGIERINESSDDGKWLTVTLLTNEEIEQCYDRPKKLEYVCAVAADRRTASIQVSTIVMAFDLVTS